ncbi:hypothetical protein EVAR_39369_1 [Eumeta japonica]|uniref:Uncharacterized protein n=1 Tax=Eumeta variegata TaxID=151549 RepID=A0A4C1Z7Z0_EUMVA|nr:hypothetical protein EVAR_39369_1 [Eumeta japonica]
MSFNTHTTTAHITDFIGASLPDACTTTCNNIQHGQSVFEAFTLTFAQHASTEFASPFLLDYSEASKGGNFNSLLNARCGGLFPPLILTSTRSPTIRYPIPFQEAGNVLVMLLVLRGSMGDGDLSRYSLMSSSGGVRDPRGIYETGQRVMEDARTGPFCELGLRNHKSADGPGGGFVNSTLNYKKFLRPCARLGFSFGRSRPWLGRALVRCRLCSPPPPTSTGAQSLVSR